MAGFCALSSPSMEKLPRLMTYCNALSPETVIVIITTIVVVIVIIIVMNGIHCYIHTPTIHHTSRWFEVTLPAPTGYIVIKPDCMNAKLPHSGQAIDKGGRGEATDKESAISKGDALVSFSFAFLPSTHCHLLPSIVNHCHHHQLQTSAAKMAISKVRMAQIAESIKPRFSVYEDLSSS